MYAEFHHGRIVTLLLSLPSSIQFAPYYSLPVLPMPSPVTGERWVSVEHIAMLNKGGW